MLSEISTSLRNSKQAKKYSKLALRYILAVWHTKLEWGEKKESKARLSELTQAERNTQKTKVVFDRMTPTETGVNIVFLSYTPQKGILLWKS